MRNIDASGKMLESFVAGQFSLDKWKEYMEECIPGAKELCLKDMEECVNAGFSWEKDFVPVLNSVASDDPKRIKAIDTFHRIWDRRGQRAI